MPTPALAPYRSAPQRKSAASFDGLTLTVPHGVDLPKLCLMCAKGKVKRKTRSHDVMPVWLAVAVMFFSTFGGIRLWVTRDVSLRYALCDACGLRAMNIEHTLQGIAIASIVVLLGFLTALLNGAPVVAVAVALLGAGLIYAAYARLIRDRRLWVTHASPSVLKLRGIHPKAAEVILDELRLPDDDGQASP